MGTVLRMISVWDGLTPVGDPTQRVQSSLGSIQTTAPPFWLHTRTPSTCGSPSGTNMAGSSGVRPGADLVGILPKQRTTTQLVGYILLMLMMIDPNKLECYPYHVGCSFQHLGEIALCSSTD